MLPQTDVALCFASCNVFRVADGLAFTQCAIYTRRSSLWATEGRQAGQIIIRVVVHSDKIKNALRLCYECVTADASNARYANH